eukprot:CAMPEP_0172871802 /NCGR_PEP_ID=MMETSP1075-20121228/92287_1 /TAXON_ID=2916 /ORGANISM="Ceratium fusus, Strain PA161109" /LENGTH=515 /DNA_ID=CAMNT_0013722087 /DNA_START=57 /DNA_END=1604 /DNA_ORIENTATION=-
MGRTLTSLVLLFASIRLGDASSHAHRESHDVSKTRVGSRVSAGEPVSAQEGDVAAGILRRLSASDYSGASKSLSELEPWQLILSTLLVLVLGSLAAGAGVGGGGLFVPIYWLILDAGPKGAVPLSKATILGGAIGNFVSIGFQRHPNANRPMIDYEASTFMQSGELLGVVFGVLLNMLLPPIFIIVFLIIILSYNTVGTLKKGFSTRAKENVALVKARDVPAPKLDSMPVSEENDDAHPSPREEEAGEEPVEAGEEPVEAGEKPPEVVSAELQAILDADAKQFPLWAWSLLLPMTLYTIGYAIIKKEVLDRCEPIGYWIWYLTPIPVLGGIMVLTAWLLRKKHEQRIMADYQFLPEDMQWTQQMLSKFPKVALLAGVTAGLLGIGGGMVIGPLFLQIGMQAQVGTSSCAFMILFTALSGVVQYVAAGYLGWELALWCIGFGFISGQIGQRAVNKILKMTGRPSYVIFLLAAIIGLACVSMTVAGVAKIAVDVVDNGKTVADIFEFSTEDFECPGR